MCFCYAKFMQLLKRVFWRLDNTGKFLIILLFALLTIPTILPLPSSWVWLLMFANYYVVLSASWNLVVGYAGQFSFAHHGLLAVGGYVSVMIVNNLGIHPALGLLMGGVAATLAGLAIGIVSLRLKGIYFALTTFGFSYIVYLMVLSEYRITGGRAGLKTAFLLYESPFREMLYYYLISLSLMTAVMLSIYALTRSKYGIFIEAIREDEDAASIYGVNIVKMKLMVFVYSSFIVGIMGAFYAHVIGYISPAIADLSVMGTIIIITVLGGLGTFFGPVLGSFIIWPLSELIRSYSASLSQIVFSMAIILSLKFFRNGIVGYLQTLITRIKI